MVGLFDWNVGGMNILLSYKFGSVKMGLESYRYGVYLIFQIHLNLPPTTAVDIKWLGLHVKDFGSLQLEDHCYQSLSTWDKNRIQSLLATEYLKVRT